jgi:methionine sulfoxide reductase heme-binding subunit
VSHDPLDYPFWLASRSAGVVAYLLLSGSVLIGLVMAARLVPVKARADLRALHERIALLALGAVGAHGLLLLPDGWLRPGLHELLIPFTASYRPVWTGLGICAAYLAAGLSLSYYARRRLGARRWRNAHRLIPVAWALAVVHVIGAGSDVVSLWLQVVLAITIAAALVLLAQRWWLGRTARPAPRPAPPPPAPEPEPEPQPAERRYAGELGLFR